MYKFTVESKPSDSVYPTKPVECSIHPKLLALDDYILCRHNKIATNIKKVYRQEKPIRLNDVYKLKLIGQCECRYCRANKKLICTCNLKQHNKVAAKRRTAAASAAGVRAEMTTTTTAAAIQDRQHDDTIFRIQVDSKSSNSPSSQSPSRLSNSFNMFSGRSSLMERFRQGYRKSKDYIYGGRFMDSKTLIIKPIVKLRESCNNLGFKTANHQRSSGGVELAKTESQGSGYKCPIDTFSQNSMKNEDANRNSCDTVTEANGKHTGWSNDKRNRHIHQNSFCSYFESFRNTASNYMQSLRRNYPLKKSDSSEKSTSTSHVGAVNPHLPQRNANRPHQMRRIANSKFYTSQLQVEYFDSSASLEGMQYKPSQIDLKNQEQELTCESASEEPISEALVTSPSKQRIRLLTTSDIYQNKTNSRSSTATMTTNTTAKTLTTATAGRVGRAMRTGRTGRSTTSAATNITDSKTSNGTILQNVLVVKANTSVVSYESMLNQLKLQDSLSSEMDSTSMLRRKRQFLDEKQTTVSASPAKSRKRMKSFKKSTTASPADASPKPKSAPQKRANINKKGDKNNKRDKHDKENDQSSIFSTTFATKLVKTNNGVAKRPNKYQNSHKNQPNPQQKLLQYSQVSQINRNRSTKAVISNRQRTTTAVKSLRNNMGNLQTISNNGTTADTRRKLVGQQRKSTRSVVLNTVTPYRAANSLQSWPFIFYTPITIRRTTQKGDNRKATTITGTRNKKKNLQKLHKK